MTGLAVDQKTTQSLIRRAQQGERAAFDELVQAYGERLRSLVRSMVGQRLRTRIEVDDILQDAYLRSFNSIGNFRTAFSISEYFPELS